MVNRTVDKWADGRIFCPKCDEPYRPRTPRDKVCIQCRNKALSLADAKPLSHYVAMWDGEAD